MRRSYFVFQPFRAIAFLAVAFTLFSSRFGLGMAYVDICNRENECKKLSRLVMGTDHLVQSDWTKEGQPEPTNEEAFRVLDEAAKQGINFFDTSPIYVGGVEHRLGKWKKSRATQIMDNDFYKEPSLNPDRKLYVLSKGGFPFDLFWAKRLERGTHSAELTRELQRQAILDAGATVLEDGTLPLKEVPPGTYASRLFGSQSQITERVAEELGHSVRNLNGDITIYLMHRDDGDAVRFNAVVRPQTAVRTIMQAVGTHEVASKFWMLGWSNWQTERINESIKLAEDNKDLPKPIINSPYFSLFEMSERTIHALGVQVTHKEMMDPNFQKGIKIMPYSPLGGFSILDKPHPTWENAKKAAKEKYEKGDPYWQNVFPSIFTAENEARWHRVVKFTDLFNKRHGTDYTVDQMVNAYALAHPRTDLLAVGAITVEQVRRTVQSLHLSKMLSPQDLEYLYGGATRSE
ncbi:MAG: aldo/keto reductase [Deltaproteobacteria bacterium]|nr:aldo/keto reductase [Deltaproteobacteria bacterium]